MKDKILKISWSLLFLGLIISVYFIWKTSSDGFWFYGNITDFTTTGQFGDFMGGVVGTVFALAGTLLIYLSFKEQTKQNEREAFESAFFEMVNLHRENVNQMNFTKSNGVELETALHRKVFRIIFKEFLECYREVKKFSNSKNVDDYILPKYQEKLKAIISENNSKIDIIELAIIDIAYNIVYYGIGQEGEIFLKDRFKRKYNHSYFYPLIRFIKLKPKRENTERWEKWTTLLSYGFKEFKEINREFYIYRKHNSKTVELSEKANLLVYESEYPKYYGGQQHRLGHYFRHLFQSYKYLNYHENLSEKEKYFYGKTLRAQLSTYEQALLFINSISSLGMKWELTPEKQLLSKNETVDKCKLITRYNLIKNLPGYHFSGIRYATYYKDVKYETEE